MEGLSEQQLLTRAKKGQIEAFAELARRYHEKVYQTVFWMTRDPHDTDDLVQEIFLKAFKHLKGFRGESSFYTWVYRMAMNTTLNFLKKRTREKRSREKLSQEYHQGASSHDGLSPESLCVGKELRGKLREAVESLPLAYKASFVLVAIQGMTHRQASRVLGCRENTVSWRMHKARRMLQERLRPYLEGGSI